MMVAGVVVIIVGFLGCCGSIKDNRFMLIAVSTTKLIYIYIYIYIKSSK